MLCFFLVLAGLAHAVTEAERASASFEVVSAKVKESLTKIGTIKKDATREALMKSAVKTFSKVSAQITPADAQALQAMRGLLDDIQTLVEFEVNERNTYLEATVANVTDCDLHNVTDINITITNLDVLQEAHTNCRIAHAQAYNDKIHAHSNLQTFQSSNHLVTDGDYQFHLAQVCVLPGATEAAIINGEWTDFLSHTSLWFDTVWPLFSEKANAYMDAFAEETGNQSLCDAAQNTYEVEVCAAKTLGETICAERAHCWSIQNMTTTSGFIETWREDNEMHPVLIQTSRYVDCLIAEMLKNTTEAMINAAATCQAWLDEPIVFNSTNFSSFFVNTTLLEVDSPAWPTAENCTYYRELEMSLYIPFSADTSTNAPVSGYYRHIVENNPAWIWNTSGTAFHSNFMEEFFTNKIHAGVQCS